MKRLKEILGKFVESGWDLISIPAQRWLENGDNLEQLVSALKQADKECGHCGCEFDDLYKEALTLLKTI